jgi:hypothetical protein
MTGSERRPSHACETWQVRDDGSGPYCMACGAKRPSDPYFDPPGEYAADVALRSQEFVGISVAALVCKVCGSLVFDLQAHAGWHADMDGKGSYPSSQSVTE